MVHDKKTDIRPPAPKRNQAATKTPADIRDVRAARAILNNFMYIKRPIEGAEQAKFILGWISRMTGESRQRIMVRSILFSLKKNPEYSGLNKTIGQLWETYRKEHTKDKV